MASKIAWLAVCLSINTAAAASYRTQNFLVTASSPEIAEQIASRAEVYRRTLAVEWLGEELAPWRDPCPVRVYTGERYGPGGETSFEFQGRRPIKWRMLVFGPLDRLLDSILPHEITHTIFATHFGRRLPPWADEGACTVVEAESEQVKLGKALRKILPTDRRLSVERMFALQTYPRDIVPLYTQGHALASYLIMKGGKQTFLRFVSNGMALADSASSQATPAIWAGALHKHYGFRSLSDLESKWLAWVQDGCPQMESDGQVRLAANTTADSPSADAVPVDTGSSI
jgi:hypothetical protein